MSTDCLPHQVRGQRELTAMFWRRALSRQVYVPFEYWRPTKRPLGLAGSLDLHNFSSAAAEVAVRVCVEEELPDCV